MAANQKCLNTLPAKQSRLPEHPLPLCNAWSRQYGVFPRLTQAPIPKPVGVWDLPSVLLKWEEGGRIWREESLNRACSLVSISSSEQKAELFIIIIKQRRIITMTGVSHPKRLLWPCRPQSFMCYQAQGSLWSDFFFLSPTKLK